ncbi:restriction endonuclease [Kibdelosporangium phytohabitans]|uniref:NACHT domain-containing protein n=1 Tax=Kibdelosporangium phytohabitans TaxID=860235 RepID=A0A0N7F2Q7_9PSEU|nr:restriction endonuclease [Kibdelosporangium phytohabitans]ALG06503.1 hypothetical protein AOZ06_05785 [Kibdelosporangium phytohabitans]MBE1467679.1 uncharacterized protein (DUF2267 family) [Kibdelosporangium phytohabitans]
MSSGNLKGDAFEEEVAKLLRLKGYKVERNVLLSGTQIDLVARRNDILDNVCLVVECGDRTEPVGIKMIKEKSAVLMSLTDPRYMFRMLYVSRNGFTAEARTFAGSHANVSVMTFDELESQLVDFTPYIDGYCYAYERSDGMFHDGDIYGRFVEPAARAEDRRILPSLTQAAKDWLARPNDNLLFLLGEYGSGKTSFCRNFTYELLRERGSQGVGPDMPLPILFNLREYRDALNIRQLVTDSLINQYGVALASFQAFERACSTGRILLVLDGFDEMAATADESTIAKCFGQFYILAALNVKVLLTCRSNFFSSHADLLELVRNFSIDVPDPESGDDFRISFKHHGRILTVEPWDKQRVRTFITTHAGAQADDIIASIEKIHDLSDLCSRPVLLDMVLQTMPELLAARTPINSAALYEQYTGKWTLRDNWRVNTPSTLRQSFCEELAFFMHRVDVLSISAAQLNEIVATTMAEFADVPEKLEELRSDIQTCSFLTRSAADEFRFAHKSFMEFFVARRAVDNLINRREEAQVEAESEPFPTGIRADIHGLSINSLREIAVTMDGRARFVYFGHVGSGKPSVLGAVHSAYEAQMFPKVRQARWARAAVHGDVNDAIFANLERHAGRIFDKMKLAGSGVITSTEIATFAAEYAAVRELSVDRLLASADSAARASVISDILRKAQRTDYIQANVAGIKNFVFAKDRGELHDLVSASCCAALTKVDGAVDFEFVLAARAVLSMDAWRYLLFEAASSQCVERDLFERVIELDGVGVVERGIAIFAARANTSPAVTEVALRQLIEQLPNVGDESEQLLGVELLGLLGFSDDSLIGLYGALMQEGADVHVRSAVADMLSSLTSDQAWQKVRSLWAMEDNGKLRQRLQKVEETLRTRTSQKKGRASWSQGGRRTAVRDKMWGSLRGRP